jgi:hypothetical protein
MYDRADLADELSFARKPGDPVPAAVYLELTDRLTGGGVRSDPVSIPQPTDGVTS